MSFARRADPVELKLYNGIFYEVNSYDWALYTYNPMLAEDNFSGKIPIPPHERVIVNPVIRLLKIADKIYGVNEMDDESDGDTFLGYRLFEWDSTTQTITKTNYVPGYPAGGFTEKDGNLYFLAGESIYEWDISANIVTQKKDLGMDVNTYYYAKQHLTLFNNKFYGLAGNVGNLSGGILFEWDPETDNLATRYTFNTTADGIMPSGSLIEKDGKFYGLTQIGGLDDKGVIFEWDPEGTGNGYTKKQDLAANDMFVGEFSYLTLFNNDFYGIMFHSDGFRHLFRWNPLTNSFADKFNLGDNLLYNGFQSVPAPVSLFTTGVCTTFDAITIDASSNNQWVPVTDSKGDVLNEIQPNENNLGTINIEVYIHNGAIRKDGMGHPYLDRNITITPQNTIIADPVELRLYITKAEFEALKADPASAITDISDLAIFKSTDACSGALITSALPIPTTYEDYEFGYVLKASVSSFSTFYFSNRTFEALPLQFFDFTVIQKGSDALLQWITEK
ncbi:MAG: hypothetical protein QM768_06595 [Agriterribacter sp.]